MSNDEFKDKPRFAGHAAAFDGLFVLLFGWGFLFARALTSEGWAFLRGMSGRTMATEFVLIS